MNNERIQRLHKFMRDFKKFMRDNHYDIDDKDIQGYLRGLVHFNVNELKERIMDYEKLYKEALERAREFQHDNCWVTSIFPELKESEDERIRGKLLQWLKLKLSNPKVGFVCEEMKQWIAWLEKQGEQSIKMRALLSADKLASAEMTGRLKERKEITDNPEKYKLCKNPAWSEEDEYVYNEILKRVADKKLYEHDLEYIYKWLKSLKPQNNWKPSEEQLKKLHYAMQNFGGETFKVLNSLYEQLKKL